MLLLLVACSDPDATDPAADASGAHVCFSSFRADVREGPNAGVALTGILAMSQTDEPEADFLAGDTALKVPMTLSGEEVTLDFDLDAGTVYGTGTMPFGIGECEGDMEGPLTGPAEGDAGDWLGTSSKVPMPEDAPAPTDEKLPGCTYMLTDGALVVMGETGDGVVGMMLEPGAKEPMGLTGTLDGTSIDVKLADGLGAELTGRFEMLGPVGECTEGFEGTLEGAEVRGTVDVAGYTEQSASLGVDFIFEEPIVVEGDGTYTIDVGGVQP